MLTQREIEREGRRIVRVLVARSACLKQAHEAQGKIAVWHVCAPNGTRKRGIPAVENAVTAALVGRGWLEQSDDGGVVPGAAGLDWLENQQRTDEPRVRQKTPVRDRAGADAGSLKARTATLNHAECPLSWLRHRTDNTGAPILSEAQFAAGERLRTDFEAAGLRQSVTSRWDEAAPRKARRTRSVYREHCPSDSAIDARRRFYAALDSVGPELSDILVDVSCFLFGLEALERRRGWPRRSAKIVLQIALTQLARHYGLDERGAGRSPPGKRSGVRGL